MNLHAAASSLRSLRIYLRDASRRLPQQQSCRAIHLHHVVTTKQVQGLHAVKGLKPAPDYEDPKKIEFDLFHKRPRSYEFLRRLTLEEALQSFIKPGVALLPVESNDGKSKIADQFFLAELETNEILPEGHELRKRKRGAKEIHFKVQQPASHQQHALSKVWTFLRQGAKVEFHVHAPTVKKKGPDLQVGFAEVQNLKDYIYLRPDVIGHALPLDSGIVIPPQIERDVAWVVAMNEKLKNGVRGDDSRERSDSEKDFALLAQKATKRLEKIKKVEFKRDERGVGIKLKEERRRIRREMKESGELKTFRQRQRETFDEIRAEDPGLGALVRRKAPKFATPDEIRKISRREKISRRAKTDVPGRKKVAKVLEKDESFQLAEALAGVSGQASEGERRGIVEEAGNPSIRKITRGPAMAFRKIVPEGKGREEVGNPSIRKITYSPAMAFRTIISEPKGKKEGISFDEYRCLPGA